MAATYIPIATQTLASPAASITFSSIPGTYTDLRLIVHSAPTSSATSISLQMNGLSPTTSHGYIRGDGTTPTYTNNTSSAYIAGVTSSNTQPSFMQADFFSYAGSTNKSVLIQGGEDVNGTGFLFNTVGTFQTTAAITSIAITTGSTPTMGTGTVATLFGI